MAGITMASFDPSTGALKPSIKVAASQLTGSIPASQVSGSLPASQISGSLPVSQVSGLTASAVGAVPSTATITVNGTAYNLASNPSITVASSGGGSATTTVAPVAGGNLSLS